MLPALTGRKAGMTRLFEPDGRSVPVTVVRIDNTRVLDQRTKARDGYDAVRIAYDKPSKKMVRAQQQDFQQAGIEDCGRIMEMRPNPSSKGSQELDLSNLSSGEHIAVEEVFKVGERVDVVGISKGKGFAGTIKRYNFAQQDQTHGNSLSHRVAGTTGQNQLPGRVFPGKKMPGHMGAKRVCKQNLAIVRIIPEERVILIRGSIPGHIDGRVIVRKTKRGNGA